MTLPMYPSISYLQLSILVVALRTITVQVNKIFVLYSCADEERAAPVLTLTQRYAYTDLR